MDKRRLDQLLVARGLTPTRSQAESWIRLGKVFVQGKPITKPGFFVRNDVRVELKTDEQYVSRAGLKLASVAQALHLHFADTVVLDVGSSTGGFTDYALQHGARKVIAVDVGTDQLHPSLQGNPKIELHEQTDIRSIVLTTKDPRPATTPSEEPFPRGKLAFEPVVVSEDQLPAALRLSSSEGVVAGRGEVLCDTTSHPRPNEDWDPAGRSAPNIFVDKNDFWALPRRSSPHFARAGGAVSDEKQNAATPQSRVVVSEVPDVVVIDVSFISLREILPHIAHLSGPNTKVAAMLKPQFEAGDAVKHKGVIKNDAMRRAILKDFEAWVKKYFVVLDKADSEVAGSRGNRERFYLLQKPRKG